MLMFDLFIPVVCWALPTISKFLTNKNVYAPHVRLSFEAFATMRTGIVPKGQWRFWDGIVPGGFLSPYPVGYALYILMNFRSYSE